MFAFSIENFMRRVPTRCRPSPLQSLSCSLRYLAYALACRTAALRSVDESGPRSGVYNTQTLGVNLTEQILIKKTTGSPERFSRGWPPAFALASRTAALRSVAESEPLVPRTLLSCLRERTSQAKRPASGPTLAGAGANSGATVMKAEVVPERRSGLSVFAWCENMCVRSSHCFDADETKVAEDSQRDSTLAERVGAPAGCSLRASGCSKGVSAGQARPARRRSGTRPSLLGTAGQASEQEAVQPATRVATDRPSGEAGGRAIRT